MKQHIHFNMIVIAIIQLYHMILLMFMFTRKAFLFGKFIDWFILY